MSTKSNKPDALNDADLAAVFAHNSATRTTEPPAELDALILANAQASQQEHTATATPEKPVRKYAPALAAAAVILIGIGLIPLNIDRPSITASKPVSSETDESITQASTSARQFDNKQIDTDATGVQSVAEMKQNLSSTSSATTVAESVEDSDALVELGTTADLQAEADDLTISPAPAPQEPNILPESTVAHADEAAHKHADEAAHKHADETARKHADEPAHEKVQPLVEEENPNASSNFGVLAPLTLAEEIPSDKKASKRQDSNHERDETQTNTASKKQRIHPENYQSSPLLWIIEIKHLHTNNNVELARKELKSFREAHPNNSNERLLPESLRSLRFD